MGVFVACHMVGLEQAAAAMAAPRSGPCPTRGRDFSPAQVWEMAGRRLSAFAVVLELTGVTPAIASSVCCMPLRRQSMIPIAAKGTGNRANNAV